MNAKANYHTHTLFCDGKAEAVCFVEEAIKKKFAVLGFSAHAPVTFPTSWTINPYRVKEYHDEIHRLKREYSGKLEIYCGLEADFFPDIMKDVQALYSGQQWDYLIGSLHFIGTWPGGQRWCIDGPHEDFRKGWREITGNDPFLPVQKYFEYTREMVRSMKPDIIGHMDKIKMQYRPDCLIPETHPFYREQVMNTLEEIASSDCIVEINTRGMCKGQTEDFYPSRWIIREMFRMKIPITISSDAHSPGGLDFGFDTAGKALKEIGYRTVMLLKDGKWQEQGVDNCQSDM
jgi:histidinol-phosphatase (PHP family)